MGRATTDQMDDVLSGMQSSHTVCFGDWDPKIPKGYGDSTLLISILLPYRRTAVRVTTH